MQVGNKSWDYSVAYIDPEEQATKTPAKRLYSKMRVKATTANRAITIVFNNLKAEYGWTRKDVVILGVMPIGLTQAMRKEDEVDPKFDYSDQDIEDDDTEEEDED